MTGRYDELDIQEQLKGHVDFDSAYLIEDYPYGGYRTQAKVWIETKTTGKKTKGDQRFMFVTLNPKNDKWNKPRTGTYNRITVMYLDSNGHVQSAGISESCGFESLESFIRNFEVPEKQKVNLAVCLKGAIYGAVQWGGMDVDDAIARGGKILESVRYYEEKEVESQDATVKKKLTNTRRRRIYRTVEWSETKERFRFKESFQTIP